MKKKYLLLLLVAALFPQATFAHFEASHEPFWYEPMHWLVQHNLVIAIIGIGLIGMAAYLKESSEKE